MKIKYHISIVFLLINYTLFYAQGDDPCSATALTVNASCISTSGTTVGATDSGIADPGCAGYTGGPDVWYTVSVPASGNISVQTFAGTIVDGGLAIYSGTCGALTLEVCDDDNGVGSMESITLYGQTPAATLWVRVWQFGGGTGTFDICALEAPAPPTNVTCSVPDPICSGSPIIFTAQANGTEAATVNPGNNYDCLTTSPNPSWYYLDIDTPGDLAMDITAAQDVDFAIWGPYADLSTAMSNCESYPVPLDCSYDPSETEQANVSSVVAGEVYVLLVTNYANTVQNINVTEAPSMTATTDCSAALPVELASFNGAWKNREIHLNWLTATETNNSHFVVERSNDAKTWSAFDLVDGMGTSAQATNYSAIDENPNNGLNYYRLKQFDFDGSMTYSDIIAVSAHSNQEVQLYPNPANDRVMINSSHFFSRIEITDVKGSIILKKTYPSIQQTILNLSTLRGGIYYVSIYSEHGVSVERMTISH